MIVDERHWISGRLYRFHVEVPCEAVSWPVHIHGVVGWLTDNVLGTRAYIHHQVNDYGSTTRRHSRRWFVRFRRYEDAFNFCIRWQGLLGA